MWFEGAFINDKGQQVDWWFQAPNENALREHLKNRSWKIVNLIRGNSSLGFKKSGNVLSYEYDLTGQKIFGTLLLIFSVCLSTSIFLNKADNQIAGSVVAGVSLVTGLALIFYRAEMVIDFPTKVINLRYFLSSLIFHIKNIDGMTLANLTLKHTWYEGSDSEIVHDVIIRLTDKTGRVFNIERSSDIEKTTQWAKVLADELNLKFLEEGAATTEEKQLQVKSEAHKVFWQNTGNFFRKVLRIKN